MPLAALLFSANRVKRLSAIDADRRRGAAVAFGSLALARPTPGRRGVGGFPALRVSAGEGDHAIHWLNLGDGGGGAGRRSDSPVVTIARNSQAGLDRGLRVGRQRRHREEPIGRRGDPGGRRAPYAPLDRHASLAMTVCNLSTPRPGLGDTIARNICHKTLKTLIQRPSPLPRPDPGASLRMSKDASARTERPQPLIILQHPRARPGDQDEVHGMAARQARRESKMAPHLLENTRNRRGNGSPDAELDPGIAMRFVSWRHGLAATCEIKIAALTPRTRSIVLKK